MRLVVSNHALELKPGMFVNMSLKIPMGRHLVIPASGVLQSGTREIAFVEHGDGIHRTAGNTTRFASR